MSIPLSYVMSFETSSETRHYKVFPVSSPPPSLFLLNTYTNIHTLLTVKPSHPFYICGFGTLFVWSKTYFHIFSFSTKNTIYPFLPILQRPIHKPPKRFSFCFHVHCYYYSWHALLIPTKINSFIANSLAMMIIYIRIALRMPLH